jgi:hypothetical protein
VLYSAAPGYQTQYFVNNDSPDCPSDKGNTEIKKECSNAEMILKGENRSGTGTKTCPSTTFSTTNLTWTDVGLNPGLRGERSGTDLLSHQYVVTNMATLRNYDTVNHKPGKQFKQFIFQKIKPNNNNQ